MSLRPSAALVVVATMLTSSAAFADKPKVAVLGLEVETKSATVDPASTRLAKELTDGLRQAASSPRSKYRLAPNSARELLDEKLMKNCDSEQPACMAPIGVEVSADLLMFGRIDKADRGYQVTIKLLDVAKRTERPAWRALIPMSAVRDNAPGWAIKQYAEIVGEEVVKPPVVKPDPVPDPEPERRLVLDPKPKPSQGSGWRKAAWASGAVAIVLGGMTAVSAYTLNTVDFGKGCTPEKLDKFACKNGELLATGTWVGGIGAGAAAIFTGIAIYKSTRGDKERSSQAGRAPKKKFAVTPVITPDGAGATVRIDW